MRPVKRRQRTNHGLLWRAGPLLRRDRAATISDAGVNIAAGADKRHQMTSTPARSVRCHHVLRGIYGAFERWARLSFTRKSTSGDTTLDQLRRDLQHRLDDLLAGCWAHGRRRGDLPVVRAAADLRTACADIRGFGQPLADVRRASGYAAAR